MTDKLWHEYDINDMPSPYKQVLTWNGFHYTVDFIKRKYWEQMGYDWIEKWCYLADLLNVVNNATVLQKKLDKAIAVVADVMQVLDDSWCCTTGDNTTVSDELFTKARDMLCSLIADLAIKKEIEDIKD